MDASEVGPPAGQIRQVGDVFTYPPAKFWLILPEAAAIRLGLSHASLGAPSGAPADGSVTRGQPALGWGITPGNWG